MKKKLAKTRKLAWTLAAILLLTACGGSPSADGGASFEPLDLPEAIESALSEGNGIDPSVTIQETVLVDEREVKITATALECTDYEVELRLTIENNSTQDLSFTSATLASSCNAVNGYMEDGGYLNVDVAAGKKANETVSFRTELLTLLGIREIADIELGFLITDDSNDTYLETGPRQVKTSAAGGYDYETDTYRKNLKGSLSALGLTLDYDSDDMAYEERGIRVLSQTLVTNAGDEQVLLVEVENTSADPVYTTVGDVAFNGLMVQSGDWTSDYLNPGHRRVLVLNLSDMADTPCRKALGIEEIGVVTYSFQLKDSEFRSLTEPKQVTLAMPGKKADYDGGGEELYQADGIRIVSKGLAPDGFELSDDIHVLLVVENGSSAALTFDTAYNSVSVNGYMTDFLCYGKAVSPGGAGVLDIELQERSLEDNGIGGLEEIEEVELTVEARDDSYRTAVETVVTVGKG